MNSTRITPRWLGCLLVIWAAGLASACSEDAALGPGPGHASAERPAIGAGPHPVSIQSTANVDPAACENVRAPMDTHLAYRAFARGVQIYRWNGTSWTPQGPLAALFADESGNSTVGSHYGGPTWESLSGSRVIGEVQETCVVDPAAVPWLLLSAKSSDGPGIFDRVSFIRRVDTVGGKAPSYPGASAGEEARMDYTATYLFYRPR